MSLARKIREEVRAIALTALYFFSWMLVLVVVKRLILAEYDIKFRGFMVALVSSLIIAKVVVVLQHVPLGPMVWKRPAVVTVIVHTILYGAGVAVMQLLEKAFESRHEYGGFGPALSNVFHHRDIDHVWVNTIWLTCALLQFNVLSVLRQRFGDRELIKLFFTRPWIESSKEQSETGAAHDAPLPEKGKA